MADGDKAGQAETRTNGGTRLSSVATAARLLKSFSAQDPEIGISALSKRLGVSKSTVHRLATTLVQEGLLEQNPETERYRLGVALFTLGALVRRRMDVSAEAKPFLYELRKATNENVHLAILEGTTTVYVYDFESPQPVRLRSMLGISKPATTCAEGMAMLAFKPESVIDAALAQAPLRRTPKTITDPAVLRERLEQVRQTGYAVDNEESELGTRSIAAPIRGAEGEVVAAVGVAGPSQRFTQSALNRFAPQVLSAAESVSMRLGYRADAPSYI